jgi:isoleucyl-tRNA synthetase
MTSELEAEGFSREISRKVQALRKEAGLVKENLIELCISVNDKKLLEMLETQEKMIMDRTNSEKIEIISGKTEKKYKTEAKDKIKDKEIWIGFNKVK